MRLFLASYRFGAHRDRLWAMTQAPRGGPDMVAVIGNACDAETPAYRDSAVRSDRAALSREGYRVHELDLRRYYSAQPGELAQALRKYRMLWVRGGNVFVLRAAMARSGADQLLPKLIAQGVLVYAGYSAGACVTAPSLRGLEALDDPAAVQACGGGETPWDGLGLIDRAIVPHVGSELDSTGSAQRLVQEYQDQGLACWALTDEQVVLYDGGRPQLLS